MSVEFFNESRRMALIKMTGNAELMISRSRKDGSTIGFKSNMRNINWKTVETQDLLDALQYVTSTDEQLIAVGIPEDRVKPQRKRDYKAEYAKRKANNKPYTGEEQESDFEKWLTEDF